ncbi:nucleotidyltransferase domain-containing protein [Rhizobium sp.]
MAEIPDEEAWDAWHPAELASRLAGVNRPWCVVGGWALDLWHGRVTREHHDLEFTVLREDVGFFRRAFPVQDFTLYTVDSGTFRHLLLNEEPDSSVGQIWCWDIAANRWRVDMMIEPGTPDIWICKRDHDITLPRAEAVRHSTEGIPYLNPAAILLLKAKHQRPKDVADFEMALPKLDRSEKIWLRDCLDRLHPDHDWISRL